MALTPEQVDALPDYSNAQMAKLLRYAMVQITNDMDAEVEVAGRRWSRHNLTTLRETLAHFEAMASADAAAAAGGGPFEYADMR